MTPALTGGILGLVGGLGLWLCAGRLLAGRHLRPRERVLPYLRDLGVAPRPTVPAGTDAPERWWQRDGVAAVLGASARVVERVLGGSATVRRGLDRAGDHRGVQEFRVEQVLWGLVGFALAGTFGVLRMATAGAAPAAVILFCLVGFAAGVIARDQQLGRAVKAREQRMMAEFPTIAELLALAVAAGEGPVGALDRVTRRTRGELSAELGRVLGEIRTGISLPDAFDALSTRTGLPVVSRFAQGVSVATERGTPLADVLHAQAADVRESGRRALIEGAARREIAMLVPVVFLVLPVTVFFAFWPGLVGISLNAP